MQNFSAINYSLIKPCEALRDKVQAIWFADNIDNTEPQVFKVFSDSAASVALNFAGVLSYSRAGEKVLIERGALLHGGSANLMRIVFSGEIKAVGIHFYPESSHQFFSVPMDQLARRILKASDENFTGIEQLYRNIEALWSNADAQQKIVALIESFLLRIYSNRPDNQKQSKSILAEMVGLIASDESIDVTTLSQNFGLSVRDIQRLFKRYIGVTPKAYIRLIRVRSVKNKIANNDFVNFTHLAIDSGYFDQSHFIRDFKLLMENTPTEYYRYKQLT